ncbi:MAG: Fe-S protein assembly co-chaperone HscB [Bacteroidetes bacterium]|nr:Fe-S protein assembly co-chaperone HscB [Bacteroidota bacterium]
MLNYFELYGLPVNFHPDAAAVKAKFYQLSRQYHPDRFANAEEEAKLESLRMSAMNNDAYKTLNSPDATMAYILKLNHLLEDEEKYSLPNAFLMEMMDLNEAVSDAEMGDDDSSRATAKDALEEQLNTWNEAAGKLTAQFNAGDHSETLLLQIKDYYFRKKYLLRIKERIDRFATP